MSEVYYLFGLPLERVSDNQFRPRAKGRPSDTGTYGERTVVRRIPESLIDAVDRLLSECRLKWESIREGVLNGTYTSPEIDLANFQMLPRIPSQTIRVGASSDGSGDSVTECPKSSDSIMVQPPSNPGNSGVKTLTKSQRKKQKWQEKRR